MCDVLTKAVNSLSGEERSEVLAALAVDDATAGAAGEERAVGSAPTPDRGGRPPARTRLVTVGVGGGPVISAPPHAGVCTAIIYDGRMYVVDLGVGSLNKLAELGLRESGSSNTTMLALRGLFFTHMHSDHCVDWPALYATGTMMSAGATDQVRVFGPGRRDTLPRVFPEGRPEPPVVEPDDPAPGITGMTGYLRKAFAADFNDRARDSNFTLPDDWYQVEDIDHSPHWTVDPEGVPPRLSEPIPVWDDGDVKITATLVDHRPTAPAYGFRFDTPDGSIVVSGDTAVSENLIDLAQGADYLVHEVIDPAFVDHLASILPPHVAEPVREHLLMSHTTIEQVGRDVAEPAGVKNLVLSHIVPANATIDDLREAQNGFSGRLVVGEELLEFDV